MWYLIYAQDREDSLDARRQARPQHLERLQALQKQGRLLLAGPMPAIDSPDPGPAGFSGSLIVAEFESLEDARDWAEADPYRAAGVYHDVDVRPFIRVLG
jgi:uncharacterized protein YciI